MRNTTFYWFRIPQGLLRGASTPWGMMALARGAGDSGSEARRAIVERYRGDVFHYSRCHTPRAARIVSATRAG